MSKRRILWAVGGAFIILAAAMVYRMVTPGPGQDSVNLPKNWRGFTRTELVEGPSALLEIDRLHNKSIRTLNGYRANYANAREQFIVWVSTTAGGADAQKLQDDMTRRIGSTNAMFSRPVPVTMGRLTAYRSMGMGQTHFYYVKGAAVYWIALTSPDPEALAARIIAEL